MARFRAPDNTSGEMTRDEFVACMTQLLYAPPPPARGADADELAASLAAAEDEARRVLPAERAWLHTGRDQARALGLDDDAMCLAPYAIDDATDLLWEHRREPARTFWLAADNVNALYWSLHDWAHYHNHGPFTDRPATELQCDAAALVWLWINRAQVPLPDAHWELLRAGAYENHLRLREKEAPTRCPAPAVLASPARLRALLRSFHTSMELELPRARLSRTTRVSVGAQMPRTATLLLPR
jgi:hypothetical protein